MNRYKTIDWLNLQEVEQELELMLSLVDLDNLDSSTYDYMYRLTKVAKALGSTKKW